MFGELPFSTSARDRSILESIAGWLSYSGFDQESESVRTVRSSLQFLGMPYLQTEELAADSIDCSTLTSQSIWMGAAIGVPFTAEGQRVAETGHRIPLSELLPGDVLVKYSSLADAPGANFNHVGLFLGYADGHIGWLIESAGGVGVRLNRVADFSPRGGCKRYLISPRLAFRSANAIRALAAAPRVPKLGRFGARQYTRSGDVRIVHTAVDIYCQAGAPVRAPLAGRVSAIHLENETEAALRVDSPEGDAFSILGNVLMLAGLSGAEVERGSHIGHVAQANPESRIRYVDVQSNTHLHFAYANQKSEVFGNINDRGWVFHNPIYACKLDYLEVPI